MTEHTPGLSVLPTADNSFTLRRVTPEGNKTEIVLSADDVLTLAEMAPTLRQQALTLLHPLRNTTSVVAMYAMDVFDFQLQQEMLGTKLLLLLKLGSSGSSTAAYALSPDLADRLAQSIPPFLAKMRSVKPPRQ
jgi:hypothetical protein